MIYLLLSFRSRQLLYLLCLSGMILQENSPITQILYEVGSTNSNSSRSLINEDIATDVKFKKNILPLSEPQKGLIRCK